MKSVTKFLHLLAILLLFEGCNTLYNTKTVRIEVYKPGKFVFPSTYKNMAVRYNNCNVSYNPTFAAYYRLGKTFTDTTNIDSIASKIYFEAFKYNLKQQQFFDSIIELAPGNYSGDVIISEKKQNEADSLKESLVNTTGNKLLVMSEMVAKFPTKRAEGADTIVIHPETGIYTKEQLQQIADSTQADLLISLDYFATVDVLSFVKPINQGQQYVLTEGIWNMYDLKLLKLEYSGNRIDTVSWECDAQYANDLERYLPPRKDAILNAAEISGENYANVVVPHWSEEDRFYYGSGHFELKKADPLIQDGKWLDAAEIWKSNVNNPNKYIAAKCMYNLGLACEMEGNIDAAIDWVVKSYQKLGLKNKINAKNCQDYLQVLGTRKRDLKQIEYQLNPEVLINEQEN